MGNGGKESGPDDLRLPWETDGQPVLNGPVVAPESHQLPYEEPNPHKVQVTERPDPKESMAPLVTDTAAEEATLGDMLVEDWAADLGLRLLEEDHLFKQEHKIIFRAIRRLRSRRQTADLITVSAEIRTFKTMVEVGPEHVAQLINGQHVHARQVEVHARVVRKVYLDTLIDDKVQQLTSDRVNRQQIVDEMRELCVRRASEDVPAVFSYQKDIHTGLEEMQNMPAPMARTGFHQADDILKGQAAGNLFIIGARPGHGKTAIALKIADYVTGELGVPTIFFSGEMSSVEILSRHVAMVGRIPASDIRMKEIKDWGPVVQAGARLAQLPLFVSDIPSVSLSDIENITFHCKAKVAIVDYLQRCHLPKAENRRLQVEAFVRGLKTMARLRGLVVILLSQLNRATDKDLRPPTLSDLRESGSIEDEADQVMLMYCPDEEQLVTAQVVDVLGFVAKNRNGPLGVVPFSFHRAYVDMCSAEMDGAVQEAEMQTLPGVNAPPPRKHRSRGSYNRR